MSAKRGKICTNACLHCRHRKRKCDGVLPQCSRCKQSNLICTFNDGKRIRKKWKEVSKSKISVKLNSDNSKVTYPILATDVFINNDITNKNSEITINQSIETIKHPQILSPYKELKMSPIMCNFAVDLTSGVHRPLFSSLEQSYPTSNFTPQQLCSPNSETQLPSPALTNCLDLDELESMLLDSSTYANISNNSKTSSHSLDLLSVTPPPLLINNEYTFKLLNNTTSKANFCEVSKNTFPYSYNYSLSNTPSYTNTQTIADDVRNLTDTLYW